MKYRLWAAVFAIAALASGPAEASAQETQDQPPREVNITQGSTPGWVPSEALEKQALETWDQFHWYLQQGDYDAAYAMLGTELREIVPLAQFREVRSRTRAETGAETERNIVKVAWTKDAPSAPQLGTYVAIDTSARYENVERHCGYVVLYQEPGSDTFLVVRTEEALLPNATFNQIAEQNTPLQASLIWNIMARNCPNYTPPPLSDSLAEEIGFESVAAAMAALKQRENVEVNEVSGWTIIADNADASVWAFPAKDSPAYPSVIKRTSELSVDDPKIISMGMLCEGDKAACDATFTELALRAGYIPITIEGDQGGAR
ncbi:MAG: DUF4019 domain-containing protein [Pseudomonadota bacterium]